MGNNDEITVTRETPPGVVKQVNEIIIERGAGQGLPGADGEAPTAQNMGDVIASADAKAILIDADSIGVSNSEVGDILVKWTYANLKTQLTAFLHTVFNLVYQPLSSALSKITEAGGLPRWDGGVWPSGGGCDWTEIIRETLTGPVSSIDFTDKLTDGYKYYEVIVLGGSTSASSEIQLQLGSGVTPVYVTSGYGLHGTFVNQTGAGYAGSGSTGTTGFKTTGSGLPAGWLNNCHFQLFDVRTPGVNPSYENKGSKKSPTTISNYRNDANGSLVTAINAFDHLRISATSGNLVTGTYILRGSNHD